MGGDCGSWTDQQHFDGQSANINSTSAWTRQYMGSQTQLSSYIYPWHAIGQDIMLSSLSKPPQLYFNNGEPHGWFYCLSTFRQAMFPPPNLSLKEQLSAESLATSNKDGNHNASQHHPQKKFLVFDQTGDQTTMIYSSGGGSPPVPCLSHWKEKQAEPSIPQPLQDGRYMMTGNTDTLMMDDSVDISKLDVDLESEMHEDTEELNALMYSDGDTDNDDDDEEDEVTSTGHSPSTLMTIHGIREEIASSDGEPTKRQKLSDEENGISLGNDHIIASHGTSGVDVDTEYMCDSGKTPSLSGMKRARKDTIGETVRKLQKMIPCGNAATPVEVIDEAINFLISLKIKAKSVGFDSSTF